MEGRDPRLLDPGVGSTTRIYTCWPFGGFLCGLSAVVIGVILIFDHYFPTSPEVLWGVALIALGVITMAWSRRRGDW